jgi:isopenicillin-N N-acyltransferase like protein
MMLMTEEVKISSTEKFPVITLEGSRPEIGFLHGRFLEGRIRRTFEYYERLFSARYTKNELKSVACGFRAAIKGFRPEYADEIEAIAEGAGMEPWQIYMLNARTEIHRGKRAPTECTTLYFHDTCLLGENWDWDRALEELAVILRIRYNDGHSILMVTEPGIIGKIGFNSSGVGVALNILKCEEPVGGIPIHVLLRSVLDSRSFGEALEILRHAPRSTMSNLMIADAKGACCNVELAGQIIDELHSHT